MRKLATLLTFFLACLGARAQEAGFPPGSANTLGGKPLCAGGVTTSCVQPLDSAGNLSIGNMLPAKLAGRTWYFGAGQNGGACDDATDDTAAWKALLTTVYASGGGTIYLSGLCSIASDPGVIPNNGDVTTPKQPYLRITGAGMSSSGYRNLTQPSPAGLHVTYNAIAIDTRGVGILALDHITLKASGANCSALFHTTNTVVYSDALNLEGTACNDGGVFGGTNTWPTLDNSLQSPFQGFGSALNSTVGVGLRRLFLFQSMANDISITNPVMLNGAGNTLTNTITTCTNASPTVCTVSSVRPLNIPSGITATLNISGFTGAWTPLNGAKTVTGKINSNQFSVAVDSSAFGSLAGTPVYLSGGIIELGMDATWQSYGVRITGGRFTLAGYPYGIFCGPTCGRGSNFIANNFYDQDPVTIGTYNIAGNNVKVIDGYDDIMTAMDAGRYGASNTVITSRISSFYAPTFPELSSGWIPYITTGGAVTGSDALTFASKHQTITGGATENPAFFAANDSAVSAGCASYGSNFTVVGLRGKQACFSTGGEFILISDGNTSAGGPDPVSIRPGGYGNANAAQFDLSVTAGDTRMLVWDVSGATLRRVTIGAADSGGTGYRVLRIPN